MNDLSFATYTPLNALNRVTEDLWIIDGSTILLGTRWPKVEKMLLWNPERINLAHGRWYEKDGTNELRRGFRWLLQ